MKTFFIILSRLGNEQSLSLFPSQKSFGKYQSLLFDSLKAFVITFSHEKLFGCRKSQLHQFKFVFVIEGRILACYLSEFIISRASWKFIKIIFPQSFAIKRMIAKKISHRPFCEIYFWPSFHYFTTRWKKKKNDINNKFYDIIFLSVVLHIFVICSSPPRCCRKLLASKSQQKMLVILFIFLLFFSTTHKKERKAERKCSLRSRTRKENEARSKFFEKW